VTEKVIYVLAPVIAGVTALFPFVAIPFADKIAPDTLKLLGHTFDLTQYSLNRGVIADLPGGILFILAVSSLCVYGTLLAGWSSDNKYSFLGAMRIASQMLSYELFLGISIMGVLMITGSMRMTEIVEAQRHMWFVVYQPIGFILYMIAGFAEACRTPFDLIECENELGSGFNTEYSSMKFALFYLGEYIHIITISAIAVTLFLGGWQGPWLPSGLWFIIKVSCLFIFFIWVRGTYPRVRFDQLMSLGWKYLLPLALANLVITGVCVLI
jgi:NADH-quinone oxidoreductase subunit H